MKCENLESKRRRKKEKLEKFKGRADHIVTELIVQMIRFRRIGSEDEAAL